MQRLNGSTTKHTSPTATDRQTVKLNWTVKHHALTHTQTNVANFLTAAKASERNERKSGEEREAKMKLKLMTLMNFTATELRTANRVLYAAASDLAKKNKSKTKSTVKKK